MSTEPKPPAFQGREPGTVEVPPHPRHGPAEAVYPYRSAAGEPLFYVCRFRKADGKKTFLQGHPGPQKWEWNLNGIEPVLYRLPEVLAHLERNEGHAPLYIIEGEKAVEALRAYLTRHGLPGEVTTSPMGAGKWHDEHTEALRGLRYAVVGADNDDSGIAHARHVAAEVARQGTRVEVKRAALDREHAGIDDHLSEGLGLEDLLELELEEEAPGSSPGAAPYPALDLTAFLAQPPAEPPWDWHGWYARGDVVLWAGDPGVGKSLVALATTVAAARGGELLGEPVAGRRALFIDLESPEDVVYDRLRGLGVQELEEPPAYVHRPAGFNLLDAEGLARLAATVREAGAELVVLDSLRRAAPGLDENDSREVSILFSALRDLAADLGCTIIVIHHPRKPVGDAKVEALYAARGSGDLTGSVDSYLFFRRLAGGLCRIEHGKARRGREHEPTSYRIVEGEAGEPVLEHVVVEPGPEDEELYAATLAHVREHPGEAQSAIEDAVEGSRGRVRQALLRGASENVLALGPGRAWNGKYWYPAGHAALSSPGEHGASGGEQHLWGTADGQLAALAGTPKGPGERPASEAGSPGEHELQPERQADEDGDIPW